MSYLAARFKTRCFYRLVFCTRAATIVEYAILLSFIAAVAIGAAAMLGSRVSNGFVSVNCEAFATSGCSTTSTGSGAGSHGNHGHRGGGHHGNHGKH